jgi:hypothetical protein
MPRKTHSARLQYGTQKVLDDGLTETQARGVAQDYSQRHKNASVVVVNESGDVKARYLNGRDVS